MNAFYRRDPQRSIGPHHPTTADDPRPDRRVEYVRDEDAARGVESVAVSIVAHDFAASSSRSASSRSSSMESFTV
jgi:hypothetical protein